MQEKREKGSASAEQLKRHTGTRAPVQVQYMLPLAPLVFPLTCPVVRPKGVGALCPDADEAATLRRLETQLEVQVS